MTDSHSFADMSASALTRAYASGEISPVEVARAVFDRMDQWEPSINAMYRIHRDPALAAAAASEARWRSGRTMSPIDGVPVTLKENLDTVGDPTPSGTAATVLVNKTIDAPPAARVREAGCTILGKTTMPDFGMLSSGLSSIHGVTRNPWRLDRNTSGSSSGAGAAGAAGYGPLHVGTDIGGSVRLPACHCGLFGLKPSLGRIPIDPPYMGRAAGPMTRTVQDAALLLSVLTGPDDRDYMSLPHQPVDYAGQLDALNVKGLRIGLMLEMGVGTEPDPIVVQATKDAGAALEKHGAIVEPVDSFLTQAMLDGICLFFEARSFNDINAMSETTREKILPFIVQWCTYRAGSFSGAQVMEAYSQVVAMRQAAVRTTGGFDYVLSPVSPILPYEFDRHSPQDDPHDALPHIAFTVAYNMSEQPASSVNWHHHEGLPVGVQVIGKRFNDLGVLQLSRVLEQLRGPQAEWPGLPTPV
ncbi:MAG: amidase [Burkholderiaceae bacterium]